ncbi:unnamed protein product [Pleuronectes platessa]|uniref:Uncharacterized protein n=1 Tax=Pleuronectes platessa TaxID=8262 RepID=A0A9N7YKJ2_PLEPL|nr:unnamed protein product [Pleuronectes platessa]
MRKKKKKRRRRRRRTAVKQVDVVMSNGPICCALSSNWCVNMMESGGAVSKRRRNQEVSAKFFGGERESRIPSGDGSMRSLAVTASVTSCLASALQTTSTQVDTTERLLFTPRFDTFRVFC